MCELETITCPVCGDVIDDTSSACFLCNTLHHQDCWQFNGGCAMFGCKEESIRQNRCTLCGTQETRALDLVPSPTGVKAYEPPRSEVKGSSFCSECTRDRLSQVDSSEKLFYIISAVCSILWIILIVGNFHLVSTLLAAKVSAVLLPLAGITSFAVGVKRRRTMEFPEIPPANPKLLEDNGDSQEKC